MRMFFFSLSKNPALGWVFSLAVTTLDPCLPSVCLGLRPSSSSSMTTKVSELCHPCARTGLSFRLPALTWLSPATVSIWGINHQMEALSLSLSVCQSICWYLDLLVSLPLPLFPCISNKYKQINPMTQVYNVWDTIFQILMVFLFQQLLLSS